MPEMILMRKAYGEALVELGRTHPNVVVLSADVSNSDYSYMFEAAFPQRFFNTGIAEPCLVDVAAGMALSGKVAIANTFATFFALRAAEQVRTNVCFTRANVKLAGAYAGLSDSFDGPTHHAITDMAVMRALPNMTVVVPSDPVEVKLALPALVNWPGPVYFRLNRNEVPAFLPENHPFEIGKAVELRPGRDVTLVGTGLMVWRCLEAAETLASEGISARVLEVHTIKPLDQPAIVRAARETGALVTAEEHSVIGGLGGAVLEALAEECPAPVVRVGVRDRFAETGPYFPLLERMGLGVSHVAAAARRAVQYKTGSRHDAR